MNNHTRWARQPRLYQHVHDTLHAAELSGDLLAASLQQVPEDLGGAQQDLAGRVGLVHVRAGRLCSPSVQDQGAVHICVCKAEL